MADGEILVVVEILEVKDPEKLAQYQAQARVQSAARGAAVVGRGSDTYFGDPFGTLLVQRWPSEAAFRDWQESDAYRQLLPLRTEAARVRLAIVQTT